MTKTSTENDLLRFIYNESTANEKDNIERQLLENDELREQFEQLRDLTDQLNNVVVRAPRRVVNRILSIARQFDVESA